MSKSERPAESPGTYSLVLWRPGNPRPPSFEDDMTETTYLIEKLREAARSSAESCETAKQTASDLGDQIKKTSDSGSRLAAVRK